MEKKIIVLLTDFGLEDAYVGVMKGVILKINPKAILVDLTHNISSHNVAEAALTLSANFSYFPKGSIIVSVVDPGVGSSRQAIIIKTKNYLFVGPDNGVLSLAAKKDGIENIVNLTNKDFFLKNISSTFHGRDIFSPVAAFLSKGRSILSFGNELKEIFGITLPEIRLSKKHLEGEVLHTDSFGNVVTNIKKNQFKKFSKGKFTAILKRKKINKLYDNYSQAKAEEPFFIEGSSGYLEIALQNKSAQQFFSLEPKDRDKVIINLIK